MKFLFPVLLGAGLLGPGWLLGRALRTPGGLIGAFIGSAVLLINLLIALDTLGLGLTSLSVAAGLAIICFVLAMIAKLRGAPAADIDARSAHLRWQHHHWFLLPAAIGLTAIAIKAIIDPLSGFDTGFRWDFLARQMLHHGSLNFYPPLTAHDFELYGWCDGIAPLVSGLYFWAYLSFGDAATWTTIPIVMLQAGLLFAAVYQLATRKDGSAAGCAAVAVLATSSVLLWGVAMGQETGLTALSLTAMFLFLENSRKSPTDYWLVWAGIAAGVGALAREYGLLFIAIGALDLMVRRVSRKNWLEFGISSGAVTLPWYLRNWIRTGNPLWSHDLFHLFPVNSVYIEYMRTVREYMGIGTQMAVGADIAWTVVALIAIPFLCCLWGFTTGRQPKLQSWAIALIILVWIWSIGQTSGGYCYSLRVLTPVIALCSVAGGGVLACAGSKCRWIMIAVLSGASLDAAGRSYFVTTNPFGAWWRIPPPGWTQTRDAAAAWSKDATWTILARTAGAQRIIASDPYTHAKLTRLGAKAVPLFSPEVGFLFEPMSDYALCVSRLSALQIRFISLSTETGITAIQLQSYPFFRALKSLPPTAATRVAMVYDVHFLALAITDRKNVPNP